MAFVVSLALLPSAPPATAGGPPPPTDPGGVKVYWAEFGADKIARVTVDGSAQETLPISPAPSGPGGLALDVGTGMVYWTDEDTSTIKRTDMEGVDAPETLVTGALSGGIALDNGAEKMFWTQGALVKSAKNDGTSQATLVSGQSCPLGIAVDPAGGKVY